MLGFNVKDLLSFDKTLSLVLMRLVYFFGLVGIALLVLIAIGGALSAMQYSVRTALGGLLVAILGGAIGTLVWRVICELWMVIFGIDDRLRQIRDDLSLYAQPRKGESYRPAPAAHASSGQLVDIETEDVPSTSA